MRLRVLSFLIAGVVSFHFLAGVSFALQGLGTESNPYLIASFEDFEEFRLDTGYWAAGVYTRLEADIDLDPELEGRQIYSQAPIAGDTVDDYEFDGTAYKGHFDGNRHVISNLTIDGAYYCGLFGRIDGDRVFDLALKDVDVTGTGYFVGGLVGLNVDGSITNCYSTGSVSGNCNVGGLLGVNWDGSITNCYSTGLVSGVGLVGGLMGQNYRGNITNCYSASSVRGTSSNIGGLLGDNHGSVTGCFWDVETSGLTASDGGVGLSSVEMRDIDTFLDVGWDFVGETDNGVDDVWWINGGRDYPRLFFQPFGDVDNDCRVDLQDFAVMSAAWRSVEGEGNFNSVCELSGDTAVDEADLFEMMGMWLEGGQW